MADGLDLDVAGHYKGYGVFLDTDADDIREVNWRQETEVHFTGETTLDSGLTVGVHVEADVNDGVSTDEVYAYFSGGWGRLNAGREDGAAYLLQVAAPSADSNVDGLRQYISTVGELDYAQDIAEEANKATYMTPVFNGFQAGASYVFAVDPTSESFGTTPASVDNDTDDALDNGYEVAVRYEGAFEGVGLAFGAGWGDYSNEAGGDDVEQWNVGLDLDFAGFGIGVAYLETESDDADVAVEEETLVVGADYQMGAYKLGASWLNQDEADLDRYTVGAGYSYGPGMSFRGSVSYIDGGTGLQEDSTQVLLGTQVNF
jgi:predicted porin